MLKLNLSAPINPTSYGLVGQNVLKQLIDLGIQVELHPIPNVQSIQLEPNSPFIPYVQQALQNALNHDHDAPSIRLWHQFDLLPHPSRGQQIGFTIYELDKFNQQELASLRSLDHLLVPSKWAVEVLRKNNIEVPASVVPLGVDTNIFNPVHHEQNNNSKFIVGNFGKFEKRKSHELIPEIFRRAFPNETDVELWMMPHNFFLNQEETDKWVSLYQSLGDRVKFIPRVETQKELANIMNQTTIGLFPSKAEGWNLEALEMMACGKPVLVTNYSAHTEFCNARNALLVEPSGLESAYDGKWFFNQGNWASLGDPQINQFSNYLRHLYEEWKLGRILYNEAGINTSQQYTWKNSALAIVDLLLELE